MITYENLKERIESLIKEGNTIDRSSYRDTTIYRIDGITLERDTNYTGILWWSKPVYTYKLEVRMAELFLTDADYLRVWDFLVDKYYTQQEIKRRERQQRGIDFILNKPTS